MESNNIKVNRCLLSYLTALITLDILVNVLLKTQKKTHFRESSPKITVSSYFSFKMITDLEIPAFLRQKN